jgi:hypothetical protein
LCIDANAKQAAGPAQFLGDLLSSKELASISIGGS